MDSMEANKAVAAILVAGIAFFITGLLGDNLVYEERPAKPAIPVQAAPPTGAPGGAQQPAGPAPIIPLLASANVQKGEAFAKQVCAACHTFDQGGKPLIGPNLYGIVGAPHDHESGFDYSAALQKFKGQPWTYDALNKWLYDPEAYAPGTHMTYAGIKNTQQRDDVIAWLRTLSPHPVPLPSAEEVAKAEQAAKPAGTTPAPAAATPTGPAPIAPLLASANVQKGKDVVDQVCAVCHTFNQGGKPLIGPNLYGIVGAPHDHEAGFDYSAALQKFKGQPWTYDALNKWLADPEAYAPGTHMTYAGLKSTQQRADVIAYLRTLSPHPVPLPSAGEVAKTEQAAKPAETTPAPAAATPTGPAPIAPLLASANVQKGKDAVDQVCAICHTLNEGGKPLIGPNLYGIVGAPHDHEAGFDYSAALQKFKGQPWTYDALNKWLYDPEAYAPGTHMTYAGIKNTQQRADVIAYLRTLSHNPAPLPGAGAEGPTKAAETAPAPGSAAPAGNKSALGSAEAPNSAPASSPNVIGPPGKAYNANEQTPNAGTQAGGTGAAPAAAANAPAANANKP